MIRNINLFVATCLIMMGVGACGAAYDLPEWNRPSLPAGDRFVDVSRSVAGGIEVRQMASSDGGSMFFCFDRSRGTCWAINPQSKRERFIGAGVGFEQSHIALTAPAVVAPVRARAAQQSRITLLLSCVGQAVRRLCGPRVSAR